MSANLEEKRLVTVTSQNILEDYFDLKAKSAIIDKMGLTDADDIAAVMTMTSDDVITSMLGNDMIENVLEYSMSLHLDLERVITYLCQHIQHASTVPLRPSSDLLLRRLLTIDSRLSGYKYYQTAVRALYDTDHTAPRWFHDMYMVRTDMVVVVMVMSCIGC